MKAKLENPKAPVFICHPNIMDYNWCSDSKIIPHIIPWVSTRLLYQMEIISVLMYGCTYMTLACTEDAYFASENSSNLIFQIS